MGLKRACATDDFRNQRIAEVLQEQGIANPPQPSPNNKRRKNNRQVDVEPSAAEQRRQARINSAQVVVPESRYNFEKNLDSFEFFVSCSNE